MSREILWRQILQVEGQAFLDAFNYAWKGVGKRMMKPFWNILTCDTKWWQSWRLCHDFVDRVVDQARLNISSENPLKRNNHKYILAHELAKRTTDRKHIRNQLCNVFLPAHDAIAITLPNIFFHLAPHPTVYAKLRQEVLSIPASANTDIQNLKKLPRLQTVIHENIPP